MFGLPMLIVEPQTNGGLIQWLNANAGAVQALTAIAIMILTASLVGITAHYARASWRVARLMESDLRYRIEPRFIVNVERYDSVSKGPDRLKVSLQSEKAPFFVRQFKLTLRKLGEDKSEVFEIPVEQSKCTQYHRYETAYALKGYDEWQADILYADELGIFERCDTVVHRPAKT